MLLTKVWIRRDRQRAHWSGGTGWRRMPIAVSAVSAQSLQNSGASDIRQLNQLAPSLLRLIHPVKQRLTGMASRGAARAVALRDRLSSR